MRARSLIPALAFLTAACGPAIRPLGPVVLPSPARVPDVDLPEPPSESAPPAAPLSFNDEEYLASRTLMVPVDGIPPNRVPDTYWQVRDGGARRLVVLEERVLHREVDARELPGHRLDRVRRTGRRDGRGEPRRLDRSRDAARLAFYR